MSWYHGGLSRTISIVPVPTLQCYDTIAQRLLLHRTSFLATTEGSSLGSFSALFLKIWPTGVQRQNSFNSWGEARVFFSTTACIFGSCNGKKPEKMRQTIDCNEMTLECKIFQAHGVDLERRINFIFIWPQGKSAKMEMTKTNETTIQTKRT